MNSEKNILLLYACIKRHANRHSVKMSQWSSEYFAPWRVFKYWNSLFMLYFFRTKSYHKKSLRTFPFSSGYSFFFALRSIYLFDYPPLLWDRKIFLRKWFNLYAVPTTEKINEAKNIDLKSNFFGNFFQNIFLYGNSFITFFFVKHEKKFISGSIFWRNSWHNLIYITSS